MSREFPDIQQSDYIDVGLLNLLRRDLAALTTFSGEGRPTGAPTGTMYDDTVNKVLACDGQTIIDYGHGYNTTVNLADKYQPLSTTLTKFASVNVPASGGMTDGTSVFPISAYFRGLNLTSEATLTTTLELGELAYKSKLGTSDFLDFNLTREKFEDGLITESPFSTGDVVFSLNNVGRPGWVRLGENVTLGNTVSGATYRGDMYKDLYVKMWQNPELECYDMFGNVVEKGATADVDWSANRRIRMVDKLEMFSGRPTTVMADEVSAGFQLEFQCKYSGYYDLHLVSGGGGSATCGSGGHGYSSYVVPAIGGS